MPIYKTHGSKEKHGFSRAFLSTGGITMDKPQWENPDDFSMAFRCAIIIGSKSNC